MFDQNLSGSSWMMHSYFASRKKKQYFVHVFLWKFFSWHIFATDITNPFVCKRFFAARKAFQQQISTVAGQRVPFSLFILQEKTPFNISTWFCVMFGTIFRKETDIVVVSCCIIVSCSSLFSVTEWILLTVLKYAYHCLTMRVSAQTKLPYAS